MAPPRKKTAPPPPSAPPEVLDIAKKGIVWKAYPTGSLLTLALGKQMTDRLQGALKQEETLRPVGPNELYSSFLYHGLSHFEREFPLRAQKQKAKKEPKAYAPPAPSGRVEHLRERLDNVESWLVRVKGVLQALERGDMEPAKKLARESIEKNGRMADAARSAWEAAVRSLGSADTKKA